MKVLPPLYKGGRQFRQPNNSGKNGDCIWCARRLRRKHNTNTEPTGEKRAPARCVSCEGTNFKSERRGEPHDTYYECSDCGVANAAYSVTRITTREPIYDKAGDYGDGFFCGLRCAYDFAVDAARKAAKA